ncbi:hypothetical protein KL928_000012 [Ogataea angusta]|uniref:Uncharacterized protein n=1 Tax=Pichia angusta TaxID=870730 RepID=A0AAN6DKJ2_PICAN|nr:uncharacterized protein KL928_000012 [Ogataea angusta]KAG7821537.1 hypothetical protein KL928_000012 [Ogataea angusta]
MERCSVFDDSLALSQRPGLIVLQNDDIQKDTTAEAPWQPAPQRNCEIILKRLCQANQRQLLKTPASGPSLFVAVETTTV